MKACRRISPLLERYADGRLAPRMTRRVSLHLASCSACRNRLEIAQSIAGALRAEPPVAAPRDFRAVVMDHVYRLSLAGYPSRWAEEEKETQRGRFYRRLGLSFMLSAAILTVSLVVPRISYPTILPGKTVAADLSAGGSSVVKGTLADADRVVRGALQGQSARFEDQNGGTPR